MPSCLDCDYCGKMDNPYGINSHIGYCQLVGDSIKKNLITDCCDSFVWNEKMKSLHDFCWNSEGEQYE
jgi:hypothetical protein